MEGRKNLLQKPPIDRGRVHVREDLFLGRKEDTHNAGNPAYNFAGWMKTHTCTHRLIGKEGLSEEDMLLELAAFGGISLEDLIGGEDLTEEELLEHTRLLDSAHQSDDDYCQFGLLPKDAANEWDLPYVGSEELLQHKWSKNDPRVPDGGDDPTSPGRSWAVGGQRGNRGGHSGKGGGQSWRGDEPSRPGHSWQALGPSGPGHSAGHSGLDPSGRAVDHPSGSRLTTPRVDPFVRCPSAHTVHSLPASSPGYLAPVDGPSSPARCWKGAKKEGGETGRGGESSLLSAAQCWLGGGGRRGSLEGQAWRGEMLDRGERQRSRLQSTRVTRLEGGDWRRGKREGGDRASPVQRKKGTSGQATEAKGTRASPCRRRHRTTRGFQRQSSKGVG